MVEAWLAQCSKTGSVETLKTYLRHITRYRAFHRQWLELPPTEQTNERLLAPGDPECIEAFAASLRQMVNTLDNNGKPKLAISTYNCCIAAISSVLQVVLTAHQARFQRCSAVASAIWIAAAEGNQKGQKPQP